MCLLNMALNFQAFTQMKVKHKYDNLASSSLLTEQARPDTSWVGPCFQIPLYDTVRDTLRKYIISYCHSNLMGRGDSHSV